MKVFALAVAQAGLLNVLPATAEYVWPSKFDFMEDVMVLQSGYVHYGFIDAVTPCTHSSTGSDRNTAAEWIRTAFHDMATHDKATGLGGLDASIQFETDRAENAGDAFNATLLFARGYYTIRSSAADLIALSLVLATGNCGGPKVPLRVGRVDATEAGVSGVPEPQQDLATHKQKFAQAGFNTEDMIAMVACGHTMGGVHGKTFPEVTGNSTELNYVHFDTTVATFDANVATEFLNGTTQNPLVVAQNDTFSSDKRIFAADNVTMKALGSDSKTFNSMCANIFERMIDTVPSAVTLSDPLEPIPLKPYIDSFFLTNASHVTLTGRIRLLTADDRYNDETVTLTYTPREAGNSTLNTTIVTTPATFLLGLSNGIFGELFKWYDFSIVLPTTTSIKSFTATVTRISTGATKVYDNAGHGYLLDDTVLYQSQQSCRVDNNVTLVAAVRKTADAPVVAKMATKVSMPGSVMPAFKTEEWQGTDGQEIGDYKLVTLTGQLQPLSYETHFDLVAGESSVEYVSTSTLAQKACAAF